MDIIDLNSGAADEPIPTNSKKKAFNRAASFDSGPRISPRAQMRLGIVLPLSRNNPRGGSRGKLTGTFTPRDEELGLHLDFPPEPTATVTLGDLRSMQQIVNAKTGCRNNIYDIKSQKKLQCVLRNGYTYKYREKKQYNTRKDYPKKDERSGGTTADKNGSAVALQQAELELLASAAAVAAGFKSNIQRDLFFGCCKKCTKTNYNSRWGRSMVTQARMQRVNCTATRINQLVGQYTANLQ